jgi:predicted acyl esterase
VAPGETVEYLLDIWPVGHVFLPGHELLVKLHAPPADDNDSMYVTKTAPSLNTLHFGPDTPSRMMLPIVPMDAVTGFEEPAGQCPYASMRCIPGG